ncbi:MBL fold metallo-hydrolase [Bernardetia sp.]|uniref:MBL fold metallo-hydrolase n=1 Tax=Bernardetia sp. TaxID=1937974 RepID=UPI0025C12D5C|nr:MBL fold metallo-hydrolase [Bernardetia sp.]
MKVLKRTFYVSLALIIMLGLATNLILRQDKFGKLPKGERLERIKKSPNYKDGAFQNIHHTPALSEDASYPAMMKEFFFGDKKRNSPADKIPSTKIDLFSLDKSENVLVWFGHSSYFMQLDGKTILVDPVFSGAASPFSFAVKAFDGTDVYTTDEIPEIDYLFISHDHWDHLDYETILNLKPKIKNIFCGLGAGAHFEHWGFDIDKIHEEDWNTKVELEEGFEIHFTPTRHFSGRGFKRNPSLWTSYVLKTPNTQIYIGGDSGYDTHFKEIGDKFGTFDLVILENGQYDRSWKYIHMMPEEVLKAAQDLNAKRLFPVHSSKFALANHAWDEPLTKVSSLNQDLENPFSLVTPIIGEKVEIQNLNQSFKNWWEELE